MRTAIVGCHQPYLWLRRQIDLETGSVRQRLFMSDSGGSQRRLISDAIGNLVVGNGHALIAACWHGLGALTLRPGRPRCSLPSGDRRGYPG